MPYVFAVSFLPDLLIFWSGLPWAGIQGVHGLASTQSHPDSAEMPTGSFTEVSNNKCERFGIPIRFVTTGFTNVASVGFWLLTMSGLDGSAGVVRCLFQETKKPTSVGYCSYLK